MLVLDQASAEDYIDDGEKAKPTEIPWQACTIYLHIRKKIIFKFLNKNMLKDAIHRQRSFWLVSAKIVVLDVAE